MDTVIKEFTITGVAGVERIDIEQNATGYIRTTIYFTSGAKAEFDEEGLRDFMQAMIATSGYIARMEGPTSWTK